MLRDGRGVKEENVGFSSVDGSTRGLRESVKQRFEGSGLLNRRMAKEQIIIYKLLMSSGGTVMERDSFDRTRGGSVTNKTTKTLCHEYKKERR